MQSLVIDATHTLNNLTESFWTPALIAGGVFAVILAGLALICEIYALVWRFEKVSKDYVFILDFMFMMFGAFALMLTLAVHGSYSDYMASPHVNVNHMATKSVTYTVKTSKSGDVISATEPGDKSGTINVEVVSNSGDSQTVKISKNSIKAVYNSGAKPTLTVKKVTDKGTNKSYYIAQKIVLNNQPIQYK